MFTGIVQAVGTIIHEGSRLVVDPGVLGGTDWLIGESIAVNGCCLTLAHYGHGLAFELTEETLSRTTLGSMEPGSLVNLERALRADDRLGGHFVQGHVDAVGDVADREGETFAFQVPPEFDRYLIDKGSIAVDGISLTVVKPESGRFEVAVIRHTLDNTNLRTLKARDKVNLEFDVLAKHVEKLLENR